jgi:uncharacterized protein (UPF0332 family)
MSSPSMVDSLLAGAETLLEEAPYSAAYRRRAVSNAYYAVFHALAKTCAISLLQRPDQDSEEYHRIYRALDHGPLRDAFNRAPLKDNERVTAIGSVVVKLQHERHRADYRPPNKDLFPLAEAQELVDQARLVIVQIGNLDPIDRISLVTSLLFRERK